jgi:hypothetical protein
MEQNIKLLQQKINILDETNGSNKGMTIPEFKTNKSQLPFEINDFNQNNSREVIKGHLSEGCHEPKKRKVIPMPGLEASFCYEFLKNEWWSKGPMHLIWGWENKFNGNFEEVVKMVTKKDKQRFEDLVFDSIGKGSHVITEPILIENGNQIVEEYNFLYHNGDYEYRSPLLLQGHTKLIRINML